MQLSPRTQNFFIAIFTICGFLVLATLVVYALKKSLILLGIVFTITYILNPLIEKIQRKYKIKRWTLSLIISILLLLIIIIIPALIIPMLVQQAQSMANQIPNIINLINNKFLILINHKFNTHFIISADRIKKSITSGALPNRLTISSVMPFAKSGLSALSGLVDTILLPFVTFYVVKNWNSILQFLDNLIPRRYLWNVHHVVNDIDKSLSYYLRGQILVIIVMAVYYMVTLNLAGLPAATTVGLLCGILVFVPYIGYSAGCVLVILFSFSQFGGAQQIIILAIILVVGNLIENFVATPFLIGDSIGLNPVMIIFALIICGNLFGLFGLIVSLPLTSIGVVLLKHLHQLYLNSAYYNRRKKIEHTL